MSEEPPTFRQSQHSCLIAPQSINVIENGTKHIFYQNIKERVNIDYTLKPTLLPTLPVAMHIDFIGQNGTVIIGKTIDFEKR
ncbi:MAG: hypothetical protein RI894_2639, partial [Bacteroidota bacterium]